MNITNAEFWKLASTNKDFSEFADQLDRAPLYGIGTKGGGRVLICENCGKTKYVKNHHQQFCSRKCHYNYYHAETIPNVFSKNTNGIGTRPKRKRAVQRQCGYCNKKFKVHKSCIGLGNSIFCSKECANKSKGLKPVWFTCNTCKIEFRAVSDSTSRHCSIECSANKPILNEYGKYNDTPPILVNPDDLIDHKINLILKSILHEHPGINLTPSLRLEILNRRTEKEPVDDYYLTTKQREQLILMNRLLITDDIDETTQS